MMEGSHSIITDWHKVLGLAQRRAEAVLDNQPWREFVVICDA